MKARMLCFVLVATAAQAVQAKAIDFSKEIEKTEAAVRKTEKAAFYDNDFLKLRHRKRIALAKNEQDFQIRLRPSSHLQK